MSSTSLALRSREDLSDCEPACRTWLVYLRQRDGVEVMIDVSTTSDLRTRWDVLRPFRLVKGAYAVPVEDD